MVKSRLGVPMGAVTESCDLCLLPLIVKLNKKMYFWWNIKKYGNPGDSLGPDFGWSFGQFLGLLGHLLALEIRKAVIVLIFSPHCVDYW